MARVVCNRGNRVAEHLSSVQSYCAGCAQRAIKDIDVGGPQTTLREDRQFGSSNPDQAELKGMTPGGWAKTITKLEPIDSGTEVFFELHYELPGGFLGQFADKLFVERAIERDVKHSSDNYKAIVEAEIPVHA